MSPDRKTFVTKPSLPPFEELLPYLREIWESGVITNGGPFHVRLEKALCEYLGVKHISLFSNGTIALITALNSLDKKGEFITTPFSFVATTHSLLWAGLTPVFVDIDPNTLNLDPSKIIEAINPRTVGILPVHCFGQPCNVEEIEKIALDYKLKVIYDAAHAFNVKCHCGSILNHGDLSVLSFHATKVFNTFEGGAIISPDLETKKNIDFLKNFGFKDEVTVQEVGINGKMSEFNSALGLLQLKYVDDAISKRKAIALRYRQGLKEIQGIDCVGNQIDGAYMPNYSYFPIIVRPNFPISRDKLYDALKKQDIFTRRYFFPLISQFPMYKDYPSSSEINLPIATKVAQQILCLPIYPDLELDIVDKITKLISKLSNSNY